MFNLPIEEYEWKENDNGNFVAISATGYLEATVFSKDYEWQIIINGEDADWPDEDAEWEDILSHNL